MTQGILFTDDEVVALAAILERVWPIGLPTIVATQEMVNAAAQRGVRSLSVRGILTTAADGSGFVLDPGITAPIDAITSGNDRVGAYIAPASDTSVLGGASITATPAAEGGWWLDAVTPQGVHGFSRVTNEYIMAAIDEMTGVGPHLFPQGADPSDYVCIVRHGTSTEDYSVVASGTDRTGWNRAAMEDAVNNASAV